MKRFFLLAVFATMLIACDDSHQCKFDEKNQVLHCSEKNYRTVSILGHNWMAENSRFFTDFSYCYQNDFKMCESYGRLYNWESSKKACPSGWRIPTKAEFEELLQYGEFEKLEPVNAGFRYYEDYYVDEGKAARFWTSDEYDGIRAYVIRVDGDEIVAEHFNKTISASIRCIQE